MSIVEVLVVIVSVFVIVIAAVAVAVVLLAPPDDEPLRSEINKRIGRLE